MVHVESAREIGAFSADGQVERMFAHMKPRSKDVCEVNKLFADGACPMVPMSNSCSFRTVSRILGLIVIQFQACSAASVSTQLVFTIDSVAIHFVHKCVCRVMGNRRMLSASCVLGGLNRHDQIGRLRGKATMEFQSITEACHSCSARLQAVDGEANPLVFTQEGCRVASPSRGP